MTKINKFDLEIYPFDLEYDPRPQKPPYWPTEHVSKPFKNPFSPGLNLIFQTQVRNPEQGKFQTFLKGVYGSWPR